MFKHVVVPVDGSATSSSALPIAIGYAESVGGHVDVITAIDASDRHGAAAARIRMALDESGASPVEIRTHELVAHSPGAAIAEFVESSPGAMVVMSSHGHGRSAAVLGSVTDDVLRRTYGPAVVVGPEVRRAEVRLDGEYLVTVDGSHMSETVLPIAEAWAIEFGAVPWIVEAVPVDVQIIGDVAESAYPARLAHDLSNRSGHPVEFEVLHGDRPAEAIVDFARGRSSSLIFATTHGRTGLNRLRLGSIAADIVRHAPCPVVLSRPPHIPD